MSWETECDTFIVQPAYMTQQDMSVPEVDRMLPILRCRLQHQEEQGRAVEATMSQPLPMAPTFP